MTTEMTTDDMVAHIREWSINKVESVESIGAKDAIYKEFEEWIEVDEDTQELEIMSLEPQDDK